MPQQQVDDTYGRLAEAVGHGKLICAKCNGERDCPVEDVARFLDHGWPQCCGATMKLQRGEEPSE